MKPCSFPPGLTVRPDGVHELSPCRYRQIGVPLEADIEVYQCARCGAISILFRAKCQDEVYEAYETETCTDGRKCDMRLKETHQNVVIDLLQCQNCGDFSFAWHRTEETEDQIIEELED